jgi:membrane protease YdiL (CAAX protease family)
MHFSPQQQVPAPGQGERRHSAQVIIRGKVDALPACRHDRIAVKTLTLEAQPRLVVAAVTSAAILLYGNLVALPSEETRSASLLWANLAMLALALAFARAAGLRARDLGLAMPAMRANSAVGAAVAAAVALPSAAVVALAPLLTEETLRDPDVSGVPAGVLLFRVAIRYPLRTVLMEEIVFRGLLFALWQRAAGPRTALFATAAIFGLWHAVITWGSVGEYAWAAGQPRFALVYAGALLTLFAAGIGLGALRERTGSVAGPFMAHWLTVALVRLAIWARA